MPYIGKEPEHGNYQLLDALTAPSGVFDGSRTVFNLTADGVAVYPTSPTTMIISLGGVLQEPNSSYTVSGNQITFTTAPDTGTNFFGVSLGDTLDIGTPSDSSVTVAKMTANSVDSDQYVDGSIDLAHMSVNSIDSDQYVDGSIDTAHLANQAVTNLKIADNTVSALNLASGSVGESQLATDAVTNAKVADDTIGVAELSATGTASSSTFLRGDNAWAAASSALQSTVKNGYRAAATASNSVPYTGAGFAPTAVIIVAQGNTQDNISFGFGDDANVEESIFARTMNGTHVMERSSVNIISGISGSDSQKAVLTSLDADGMTLAWTKAGSGEPVNFLIMYLR